MFLTNQAFLLPTSHGARFVKLNVLPRETALFLTNAVFLIPTSRGFRLLILCICMFAVVIYAAIIESQADVRLGI